MLSRNKLGYDEGLAAMVGDPLYDEPWRAYIDMVRRQGEWVPRNGALDVRMRQVGAGWLKPSSPGKAGTQVCSARRPSLM